MKIMLGSPPTSENQYYITYDQHVGLGLIAILNRDPINSLCCIIIQYGRAIQNIIIPDVYINNVSTVDSG